MQKIIIFGLPGAGKTTFSQWLTQQTGIPVFHLDKYFFLHDWQERSKAEFLAIQKKLLEGEQWIIECNCMHSLELRTSKADTILYFCFNRWVCLYRILKRFVSRRFLNRSTTYGDRTTGCAERLNFKLIKYLWQYRRRWEPMIHQLVKAAPQAQYHVIMSDAEAKAFLERL